MLILQCESSQEEYSFSDVLPEKGRLFLTGFARPLPIFCPTLLCRGMERPRLSIPLNYYFAIMFMKSDFFGCSKK